MLPVSGAEQLKAIGATIGLRPICSQRIPYSQLVRPAPNSSPGRKRFQSPCSLAWARISTRICGIRDAGLDLVVDRLDGLGLDRIDSAHP